MKYPPCRIIETGEGALAILPHITTDTPYPQIIAELERGADPQWAALFAAAPEMRECLQFVADAINRLRDSRAVAENNHDMLAEELNDMERQATAILDRIRGYREGAE